jgi:hypothetical protein
MRSDFFILFNVLLLLFGPPVIGLLVYSLYRSHKFYFTLRGSFRFLLGLFLGFVIAGVCTVWYTKYNPQVRKVVTLDFSTHTRMVDYLQVSVLGPHLYNLSDSIRGASAINSCLLLETKSRSKNSDYVGDVRILVDRGNREPCVHSPKLSFWRLFYHLFLCRICVCMHRCTPRLTPTRSQTQCSNIYRRSTPPRTRKW